MRARSHLHALRARKCTLQGVENELMDGLAVAKAHFGLGRMHVHVHARRVELQVQGVTRLMLVMQHVLIRGAHSVLHHAVAHEAAVDVEELFAARSALRRQRKVAGES